MNATLIDGCKRNLENPDNFPIPEPEAKELIRPGSYVKLMSAGRAEFGAVLVSQQLPAQNEWGY